MCYINIDFIIHKCRFFSGVLAQLLFHLETSGNGIKRSKLCYQMIP